MPPCYCCKYTYTEDVSSSRNRTVAAFYGRGPASRRRPADDFHCARFSVSGRKSSRLDRTLFRATPLYQPRVIKLSQLKKGREKMLRYQISHIAILALLDTNERTNETAFLQLPRSLIAPKVYKFLSFLRHGLSSSNCKINSDACYSFAIGCISYTLLLVTRSFLVYRCNKPMHVRSKVNSLPFSFIRSLWLSAIEIAVARKHVTENGCSEGRR